MNIEIQTNRKLHGFTSRIITKQALTSNRRAEYFRSILAKIDKLEDLPESLNVSRDLHRKIHSKILSQDALAIL